jgi:hypothetical protein
MPRDKKRATQIASSKKNDDAKVYLDLVSPSQFAVRRVGAKIVRRDLRGNFIPVGRWLFWE